MRARRRTFVKLHRHLNIIPPRQRRVLTAGCLMFAFKSTVFMLLICLPNATPLASRPPEFYGVLVATTAGVLWGLAMIGRALYPAIKATSYPPSHRRRRGVFRAAGLVHL